MNRQNCWRIFVASYTRQLEVSNQRHTQLIIIQVYIRWDDDDEYFSSVVLFYGSDISQAGMGISIVNVIDNHNILIVVIVSICLNNDLPHLPSSGTSKFYKNHRLSKWRWHSITLFGRVIMYVWCGSSSLEKRRLRDNNNRMTAMALNNEWDSFWKNIHFMNR